MISLRSTWEKSTKPGIWLHALYYCWAPMMYITPQAADRLLATAGSSLAQLDELARGLEPGKVALTRPGARIRLALPLAPEDLEEKHEFVMGFIPGTGALMGEKEKGKAFGADAVKGLDSNVIIVSAYYDGLGMGPDGTLYPGANDNASSVAAMLEMARGAVADQLAASARVYSATVKYAPVIDWSDSLPFHESGVPTAMLMCSEVPSQTMVYHRPEDDVKNIQLGSLRTTGVLAAHTLAAWSGGGPTRPLPPDGTTRYVWDLILPTPACPTWPMGSMTCDHGKWSR
jgi:hypothetical protein